MMGIFKQAVQMFGPPGRKDNHGNDQADQCDPECQVHCKMYMPRTDKVK